jgi:hypothetical protein
VGTGELDLGRGLIPLGDDGLDRRAQVGEAAEPCGDVPGDLLVALERLRMQGVGTTASTAYWAA